MNLVRGWSFCFFSLRGSIVILTGEIETIEHSLRNGRSQVVKNSIESMKKDIETWVVEGIESEGQCVWASLKETAQEAHSCEVLPTNTGWDWLRERERVRVENRGYELVSSIQLVLMCFPHNNDQAKRPSGVWVLRAFTASVNVCEKVIIVSVVQ